MVYNDQDGVKPRKPESEDLALVTHGKKTRATVTLTFEVGKDDDLINAVNKFPKDQRQKRLKSAIRLGIPGLKLVVEDQSHLEELLERILSKLDWLVEYLTPLHEYLEEKFSRIGTVVMSTSPFAPKDKPKKRLTPEQIAEIERNTQEAEY